MGGFFDSLYNFIGFYFASFAKLNTFIYFWEQLLSLLLFARIITQWCSFIPFNDFKLIIFTTTDIFFVGFGILLFGAILGLIFGNCLDLTNRQTVVFAKLRRQEMLTEELVLLHINNGVTA